MPGYKAFVQGYSSPQNLILDLEDGPVSVTPVQGSVLGPVDVKDPEALLAAIQGMIDLSNSVHLWPEDAEDVLPEPVEYEPVEVAPLPQQNVDIPGPDDESLLQGGSFQE